MRRNNIKTCIRRQRFKQIKIKEAFRIIPLKTETKGIGITFQSKWVKKLPRQKNELVKFLINILKKGKNEVKILINWL